jgi:hypothetical protein
LPLLTEPLGCDERRPAGPMKRRWRNCSQVIPSWDGPVLHRITASDKRALRCVLLHLPVSSFQLFLLLPDTRRLKAVNLCRRARCHSGNFRSLH